MQHPLRLLVYDRTGYGPKLRNQLSAAWKAGSVLYRGLGRLDAAFGAAHWKEALDWLGRVEPDQPIGELQFWGHGRWGRVLIGEEPLDREALSLGHPLYAGCVRLRERLLPDARALLWWRTCEAFGAKTGQDFAQALAEFFGCPVAGHTYVIGFWQSGLWRLMPGDKPDWSMTEGVALGTAEAPEKALGSSPRAPRTISCLHGRIPDGW
jgi:hypothetical protein